MIDFSKLSTIEFIQSIRSRPAMWLGNQIALTNLEFLVLGFDMNVKAESLPPFSYFNNWVKEKLNKFGPQYNWKVAILEICRNDEKLAFYKFFELLDEFMMLKPKSIWYAYMSEKNLECYYLMSNQNKSRKIIGNENKYVLEPAPYAIKIIQFNYCSHAYYYDYYYVVGDSEEGRYYQQFDSVIKGKNRFKEKFGELKWEKIPKEKLHDEYKSIIQFCKL